MGIRTDDVQSSTPSMGLEMLAWMIAAAIPAWMAAQATRSDAEITATIIAGTLSILFGARAFVAHGRKRITVTGLFNLSTALFMGYAAIIVATDYAHTLDATYLAMAVVGSLAVQIATTVFAWGKNTNEAFTPRLADRKTANWVVIIALISLAGVAVAHLLFRSTLQLYTEAAAFTAIAVLAVGLIWRDRARIFSWSSVLLAAALALYAEWFHSGQGRLRIVALACVVAILYSTRFQYRWIKYAILAGIPLALSWLASDRLEHQESLQVGASAGRTGLESMYSSTIVFAQLLQAQRELHYPLSLGYNLLSFPAMFVPESLWPGKPEALGYELVKIHQPEKFGTGFTVVASSTGEAVYNFGLWGFLLAVPVVALILRLLDRQVERNFSITPTTAGLIAIAFWVILAGAIADFTWAGYHIFMARTATRMPLLIGIFVLAWMHSRLAALPKRKPKFYTQQPGTGRVMAVARRS